MNGLFRQQKELGCAHLGSKINGCAEIGQGERVHNKIDPEWCELADSLEMAAKGVKRPAALHTVRGTYPIHAYANEVDVSAQVGG
jgi:hypothetical protein